ncbi:MAG TPA: sialidase family protein [Ktedonobacterales bacterium]
MSDQRDDLNSLDDTDALPPHLEDVHRLLLRDGARWRARLPDSASHAPIEQQDARVDRRVETPTPGSPGSRGSQNIQQNVRKEVYMHDTNQIDDGPSTPATPATATKSRFRGIAAVGAAVVVVALFAGLLYTFGPGHTTAGNSGPKGTNVPGTPAPGTPILGTAAATQDPNDNGWPAIASLQKQPAVPIFAPGNPAIIYEAGPTVLRRSDDGGKSWHTLTLPSDSGSNPAFVNILVSPLDARKAILQVTAYQAQGVNTCPTAFSPGHGSAVASSGAVPLSSNIPSSGSISCTVQYFSADGGQHWAHLNAPGGKVLGNKGAGAMMPDAPSTPIFAQGSRLYTYAGCGPVCNSPDDYRIVTSTDGGATWSYADDALASQSAHVCSFMPTVSGSTLFALTSNPGCSVEGGAPNPALWSSTDGGATWSRATLPTSSQVPQRLLVISHGSQTLVYLNLQAPPQSHIGAGPGTPADLRVSTDGGRHWSAAPASGVPAGYGSTFGAIGALSDGTVVEPFSGPGPGDQVWPVVYGWKPGDAAWHRISKPLTGNTVSFTIVPGGSAGQDQIWGVTQGAWTGNTPSYNVGVITVGK